MFVVNVDGSSSSCIKLTELLVTYEIQVGSGGSNENSKFESEFAVHYVYMNTELVKLVG